MGIARLLLVLLLVIPAQWVAGIVLLGRGLWTLIKRFDAACERAVWQVLRLYPDL